MAAARQVLPPHLSALPTYSIAKYVKICRITIRSARTVRFLPRNTTNTSEIAEKTLAEPSEIDKLSDSETRRKKPKLCRFRV